ncbi:hypothetical protein [Lactobacillus sp. M0396]|uniref:hypothetical protein n=1 Tax=Lactobacillus sp. M0396 TaxID=2751030 RepID=UPI001E28D2C6|nr:hypothetical protein [Lactobacillus sp. M0396]
MLLLNRSDIEKCYSLKDCIDAVADAFKYFSAGKVDVPLRTQILKKMVKIPSCVCRLFVKTMMLLV